MWIIMFRRINLRLSDFLLHLFLILPVPADQKNNQQNDQYYNRAFQYAISFHMASPFMDQLTDAVSF
jgi:hypothetical protein